jgi:protein TonB
VGGVVGGTGKVIDFDFAQVKIKYQPPPPPYPPLAKIAKIQGTVVVEITIGPDGVPTQANAKEGPPQLRPAAENYAMQWRFFPAELNGVPQYARFKLTMPFRLR